MRDDFEEAADFLMLTAPAPKEIVKSYRISAVSLQNEKKGNGGTSRQNDGIGKTGVEFRYHTRKEYEKLNSDQRAELHSWRKARKVNSVSVAGPTPGGAAASPWLRATPRRRRRWAARWS